MDEEVGGGNQWAVPGAPAPDAPFQPPPGVGGAPGQPPHGPGNGPGNGPGIPALPGAQPEPDGPGAAVIPGTGIAAPPRGTNGPGSGATAAPDDIPHLGLHPMTVADILDGAFSIIKARPLRLLGIAAVFVVPVNLLAAYLQRNMLGGVGLSEVWSGNFDDPAVVADSQSSGGGEFWATILVWIVPALALMFVAAAIAKLLDAWAAGHDLPAGDLLKAVGRSWWPLVAAYLLVHLAEGAGALTCYIGTVAAMAFFSVTAPVIGAEGLGPIAAMKRSANLVGSRFWPVLGINLLIGIVETLLAIALGGLPEFLGLWFGLDVAWALVAVGNIISAVIATPFVAAATVLLYLDLRVRSEGLDLDIAARELVDGAA